MVTDYFPLVAGRVLTYRRRGPEGEGRVEVETLSVRQAPGRVEAECRAGNLKYLVVVDGSEVRAGGEVEFPLPALPGRSWRREPRDYRVEALDGRADTPAGLFESCLVIGYEVAGGDGGFGRRYYAPSVGLVLETSSEVGEPFELALAERRP